ncbi:hypothetical protein PNEG_00668 [Pneumocystis murina B123]|uniref:Muniscin C-terminal domain-containing protein n=1 Tax=Pneumocystis murina (strain B123) TaxID=1069680 RepID=M7NVB0_PNEMU|nr:hypothetical protein PNEG_00668 [Pneumocystis murina B123]EMR11071.1 hypothetical protein PNEG_00668 [Pneumocystis murina B123]
MLLLSHKHTKSTEQGPNCSIIENVNASIKNNEPKELKIQERFEFSYEKKKISKDFLNIQITGSKNFSKISFDKNILKNISANPTQYLLDLQRLSQIIPVLRYEIIVNINKIIFQPILITSQWKHI